MADSSSVETEVELYEEIVGNLNYTTPVLLADHPGLFLIRRIGQPPLLSKDPSLQIPARAQ